MDNSEMAKELRDLADAEERAAAAGQLVLEDLEQIGGQTVIHVRPDYCYRRAAALREAADRLADAK